MKKNLLMLLLPLCILQARAQDAVNVVRVETTILELMNATNTGQMMTFDMRYQGVRGTPALFEDWKDGEVVMRGNMIIKEIQLNYDAYNDKLMFRKPDGQAMYANEGNIEWFVIGEEDEEGLMLFKKKPVKIDNRGKETERFVHVVFEGKSLELYQVFEKQFVKADYERAYSADRRYDEFVDESYFVVFERNKTPEKFKPGKKSLLKLFSDREAEMVSYFSENKPDFDRAEDLQKIFSFYESFSQ